MDATARHLRLLTETIAAVNSSLDLQEVLELVASKVADALGTDACFVYLYDERADELVLRATHGTRVEELTRTPRMRPGEGITGVAAAERAPVMIAGAGPPRPALQGVPEPPGGRVRVDPRRADSRAGHARGSAQRPHARAARVHATPRSSCSSPSPRRSRRRSSTRSCTTRAQRRVARARGAGADLGGRLRVALPRGVARGDREDDDGVAARDGRGARARGREDRVAGGSFRRIRGAHCRCAGSDGRSASSSATGTRRSPTTTRRCSRRSRTTPPSRSSTAGRSCAVCSLRRSTTASRTTCRRSPRCFGCRRERRTSTRGSRSRTRSTGSSRSPRCTRC